MPWYELKKLKREPGGASVGKIMDIVTFEAADDKAAIAEAMKRSQNLPPDHFTILVGPGNTQITTCEAPDA